MRILRRESLREHTSLRVGGRCRFLAQPRSVADLSRLLMWRERRGLPFFTLGGGTNTLFHDHEFDGVVIAFAGLTGTRVLDGHRLSVLPGTPLKRVVKQTLQLGWQGLESFVGIPGTLGGAVYGNAGGSSGGIGALVHRLRLMDPDGCEEWCPGARLPWRYRSSGIGNRVIAEVILKLAPGNRARVMHTAREVMAHKVQTQPLSLSSAGCVYRNQEGRSAGHLIEAAGLKGARIG
ncbi:MAG: FAD-binding protein, partial [Planctomycetota bacterium]